MSYTTYNLIHHPTLERDECFTKLAQLFDHCLSLGITANYIFLQPDARIPTSDEEDIVYDASMVDLDDLFCAVTTVDGVNAEDSETINVVSTAGFNALLPGQAMLNGTGFVYNGGVTATSLLGCGSHQATVGGEPIGTWMMAWAEGVNAVDSATINVNDTAQFPSSGSIKVRGVTFDYYEVTYTGKTATSFTGCGPHIAVHEGSDVYGPPPLGIHHAEHLGLVNPYMVV